MAGFDDQERLAAVRIGPRCVGPAQPVYVIAEAGVNHNGSVETALRMADAARAAGADAVKFQVFQAQRLASRHAEQAAYQKAAQGAPTGQGSQREMLGRLELRPADFERIKRHCDAAGIEFLATPFGVEDLQLLTDLGVRAVKIASPDIVNVPLLRAAAGTRLPVLLSTGASQLDEIDAAVQLVSRQCRSPLVLLHCVSSYPTALEQANLRRIAVLRERYGCPIGYSDHTAEPQTAALAVAGGACLLEKHFTLDRAQPGPDHAFSLEPAQLAEYVRLARQAQRAMGTGSFELAEAELEIRRLSRSSITAARDIEAGQVLAAAMLVVKRPGYGIPPNRLDEVLGRVAKCPIPADTPITWEMLT